MPANSMLLTDNSEEKILGRISCRRISTEGLRERGGNIGYMIMPSVRNRRYGTKMLELFLKECKNLGLFAVMLTCDKENIPSKSVILSNGGVLYSTGTVEDGTDIERYYILTP